MKLRWDDFEDIGIALFENHAGIDPLSLSFTKLHTLVIELDEFDDDPKASNEGKLEAIQMAWYEEIQENS